MGPIPWIRTNDELERTVSKADSEPLALDVEADSFHHYREQVCLVQLALGGRVFLLDPLADVDLARLAPVLGDGARRKVLHGADYDLRILHRDFGLEVRGVFDTMIAARLAGERSFGLASLLARFFDVRLDKSQQRADWSVRPLPAVMEAYAAEDVRHLLALATLLEARLQDLGRLTWADEEFRRLEAVRWTAEGNDPEAFRKLKGARDLEPAQLAVLKEVHGLRDAEARRRDLPLFKVLRDEALLALAREQPQVLDDLRGIPHLPQRFRGPEGERLLRAVARGRDLPPEAWPRLERVASHRPDRDFEARVRRAQKKRDALAAELDIEPSVLAPRAVLEGMLRRAAQGAPPQGAEGLRAWQARLLEPILD